MRIVNEGVLYSDRSKLYLRARCIRGNTVCTMELLNVDSLNKGYLLYSGHFLQHDIKVY